MKIRAAILDQMRLPEPYAKSRPLTIVELELDDPGHGELLIKIRAAGLCHSDLSVIDGDRPRPIVPGGVAYALEMANSIKALELAWQITAHGGTTITAGLPHPDTRLSIPPVQLVAEERTLKGSYLGSCVPARDIPRYIDWYRRGELPVDKLLSERIHLSDINAAFDRLATGQTIRTVVEFCE